MYLPFLRINVKCSYCYVICGYDVHLCVLLELYRGGLNFCDVCPGCHVSGLVVYRSLVLLFLR